MAYLSMAVICIGLAALLGLWWKNNSNMIANDKVSPFRSIADIAEESIVFWTSQLARTSTLEQSKYCFTKVREAQKDINNTQNVAKAPVVESEPKQPTPDNLFHFKAPK